MGKMEITYYLDEFWRLAKANNRLKLLKEYSIIKVSNKVSWGIRRKEFKEILSAKDKSCFVCNQQPYERHHIIQLQNGGTNSRRNIIALCSLCHDSIHPWLKDQRVRHNKIIEFKPRRKSKKRIKREHSIKETNEYNVRKKRKKFVNLLETRRKNYKGGLSVSAYSNRAK